MSAVSSKAKERLLYLISPIGLLALWQVLLMLGLGDRRFIPTPSDIAWRYWEMVVSGELAQHTAVTLWRVFAGFFIGSIPGIAVGLLMAMFRPVRIFIDPLIAALFPIPKIALMPLFAARIRIRRCLQDRARRHRGIFPGNHQHLLGRGQYRQDLLGRRQELRREPAGDVPPHRVLRRAADDLRGLRIALAVSFIVLVAAEFVATKSGIGYLIWNSWELLQVDIMFVGIVTVGILGLIATVCLQEIERKVIPWKAE